MNEYIKYNIILTDSIGKSVFDRDFDTIKECYDFINKHNIVENKKHDEMIDIIKIIIKKEVIKRF